MHTNICLKEWSAVVSALGSGKQTILIRGFTPEHKEFLLYPTFSFFLQNGDKLDQKFQRNYVEMARESGEKTLQRGKYELLVDLEYFAKLDDVIPVEETKIWKALESYYVWTSGHVLEYAKTRGGSLFLWILRVYRLKEKVVIGRWNMGGPPTWYRHGEPISFDDPSAVIETSVYESMRNEIITLSSR